MMKEYQATIMATANPANSSQHDPAASVALIPPGNDGSWELHDTKLLSWRRQQQFVIIMLIWSREKAAELPVVF
jgi:hypothetical protein